MFTRVKLESHMQYGLNGYGMIFLISTIWYLISPDTMSELSKPIINVMYPAHILTFCRQFFRFDSFIFICLLISIYWIVLAVTVSIRLKVSFESFLFMFLMKAGILYILAPFCSVCSQFFFNITDSLSTSQYKKGMTCLHVIVLMFIYRDIILNDFLLNFHNMTVTGQGGKHHEQ